jgi:hypothetical protein
MNLTLGCNLGKGHALINKNIFSFFNRFCSSKHDGLVSVSYESPFFRKSFKTPFTVSLVCT